MRARVNRRVREDLRELKPGKAWSIEKLTAEIKKWREFATDIGECIKLGRSIFDRGEDD